MPTVKITKENFNGTPSSPASRCCWISGPAGAAPAGCSAPPWRRSPRSVRISWWAKSMWTRSRSWPPGPGHEYPHPGGDEGGPGCPPGGRGQAQGPNSGHAVKEGNIVGFFRNNRISTKGCRPMRCPGGGSLGCAHTPGIPAGPYSRQREYSPASPGEAGRYPKDK